MCSDKKYVKILFGNKSSANGFEYKINEINISNNWNPKASHLKDIGGFSISTEDKILRFLIRGDTIYDVSFPENTEIIECKNESAPQGVFVANKIILTNPKIITDEMAMKFYEKSKLPEKSYFKAMAGCSIRGYMNTAKQILKDKVNRKNIEVALLEFEEFCNHKYYLNSNTKEIYTKLKKLDL